MRRKPTKQSSSKSSDLINLEATSKKLQSFLSDPYFQIWSTSGAAAGIRRKVLSVDYTVLRNVVERVPLFNAVINTRIGQMLPFCHHAADRDIKGFQIINTKDPNNKKDKNIDLLADFFEQTGFSYSADREDDLTDFMQMFIRDTVEIDQVSTEIQRNRAGEACAFWALDPATIMRVDPAKSNFNKDTRFVQLINLKVENEYSNNTLVFDYMNKRSAIRHRGFGYSVVEQVIDIATTLLFGYNYIRDQLVRDRVPKGFISVMGDVDGTTIDSIRRYWYAAMSGSGGQWNIPILPSGKDGIGIDFKTLGQNNKDMEYHKTMMFISSIISAVASIDLAEMGMKADDSSSLIGESSEPRLEASRNRGLGALLAFFEQHLNKICRKVSTDYRIKFIGFEPEDEARKADLQGKRLSTHLSIDQICEEEGLPKYNEDWSKIPLNPYVVQMVMAQKQQEMQQQQQEAAGGEEDYGYDEEEEGGGEEEQPEEQQSANQPFGSDSDSFNEDMFKAITDLKTQRVLARYVK